ncbi:SNF2 family N-terminal domain-containing protein [Radiomyces spectabilis]|uniref:SNF2 family N-terminal domain-containing protein n=1 Tax=Radiomyces spectabilis TaxID=64574 RepID=UPI00221F7E28|nr:SNF2 family N-terminal domain-containing protein [Radiomyces spectabilis]KAI8391090.1 SNF2 family N-terminal domain-containing protein [Radiomyces spectabilis]
MITIDGSIGHSQAIAKWLLSQQRQLSNRKLSKGRKRPASFPETELKPSWRQKKRFQGTIDLVRLQLPVHVANLDLDELREFQTVFEDMEQALRAVWSTGIVCDLETATMKIKSADGVTLITNEIMYSAEQKIDDATNIIATIARLVDDDLADTVYIQLYSDDNGNLICELSIRVLIESTQLSQRSVMQLINQVYPPPAPPKSTSLEEFNEHLQPPVSDTRVTACTPNGLTTMLTPFQTQNVQWMLAREGHTAKDPNRIECLGNHQEVPFLWETIHSDSGQLIYINRVAQKIAVEWTDELQRASYHMRRGGILADEMGLGKTLSTIALILLHKLNSTDPCVPDPATPREDGLIVAHATLVVAPAAILQQWRAEIERHAPMLRYFVYEGVRSLSSNDDMEHILAEQDIVLVSYETLRVEVHYTEIRERSRRKAAKYPVRQTPLMKLLWWRCVLDEAQMVETAAGAASMARLIPRWYSWCVSGTPMRKSNHDDLYWLYLYLECIPSCQKQPTFLRLSKNDELRGLYWELTKATIRRNTKAMLVHQINIPPQRRFIVNVSFSTIEQHYYDDMWARCRGDVDLPYWDAEGWQSTRENEQRYTSLFAKLRSWLLMLRQTCVHPAVGNTTSRRQTSETIHTLEEVLHSMIEQTSDKINEAETALTTAKLKQAGMFEVLKDWGKALEIYLQCIPHVAAWAKAMGARCDQLKLDYRQLERQQEAEKDESTDTVKKISRGPKKAHELQKEHLREKLLLMTQRHGSWLGLLHRFYFFTAGIYHELEKETEENDFYAKAADVRRQMLLRMEDKFTATLQEVKELQLTSLTDACWTVAPTQQKETFLLTASMLERIQRVTKMLNDQIDVINNWRQTLLNLLTVNLVDHGSEEDETKGNEYEESLVLQEQANLYQDAYQAILRDRNFWVNGTWFESTVKESTTADSETTVVEEATKNENSEDEAIKVLKRNLRETRRSMAPSSEAEASLRSIATELREAMSRTFISELEKNIIRSEIARLTKIASTQRELQDKLDSEFRKLSHLSNTRIEYYKALQAISDHVVAWENANPTGELKKLHEQEKKLKQTVSEQSARHRYLQNLAKEKDQGSEQSEQRICLICQTGFDKGIVTFCGHVYCESCALAWFSLRRKCPQCNATVNPYEWYTVAWSQAEVQTDDLDTSTEQQDIGSSIPSDVMRKIETCNIKEGLGAKLDAIVRHIKYIKETTNGKCVVFSQWSAVLRLLASGLETNDISAVNFTSTRQQEGLQAFREDPNVNVLLLHARSHARTCSQ